MIIHHIFLKSHHNTTRYDDNRFLYSQDQQDIAKEKGPMAQVPPRISCSRAEETNPAVFRLVFVHLPSPVFLLFLILRVFFMCIWGFPAVILFHWILNLFDKGHFLFTLHDDLILWFMTWNKLLRLWKLHTRIIRSDAMKTWEDILLENN